MTLLRQKSDKHFHLAIKLVYETAQRILEETGQVNLGPLVEGMIEPCANDAMCREDVRAAYEIILFRLEASHGPLMCSVTCGPDEPATTWTYAKRHCGDALPVSPRKSPKLEDVVSAFAWRLASLQEGHPDSDVEDGDSVPFTVWRRAA
jgi:hypothetical protein